MPHQLKYDWSAIQEFYNQGYSLRDCRAKFGFGSMATEKAIRAGRLIVRSQKEACALLRKKEPSYYINSSGKYSPTVLKGEIACAKFDLRALQKGIVVSKPVIECAYDRVADIEDKLFRVQVKYGGGAGNGVFSFRIQRNSGTKRKANYREDEIDIIVVYSPLLDKLFWLDKTVWLGKSIAYLRYNLPKNGQQKRCIMADSYIW